MITLPDFREKQILIIPAKEMKEINLSFRNENVLFKSEGKIENQLSCHKIIAIFIVGDFTISSVLLRNCRQYNISLFLLKNNFQLYAQINNGAEGNYLLRARQYSGKENELEIAKKLVLNKIKNQLNLLRKNDVISGIKMEYSKAQEKVKNVKSENELLGVEGDYSKRFFSQYFLKYGWYKRQPRTRVDEINFLMDIGYTYLFNFIDAVLSLFGFDSYKGVYHKLFFQRKSLACDLMEPFRCLIDKEILKAFNLRKIDKADFKIKNGKMCVPYKEQLKYLILFLDCIMSHKEEIYKFIRQYYYFVINNDFEFPEFIIK
jgi:CRISPR-associated protein Cas1